MYPELVQMHDVEEIMKTPWESFNQLLVFRRHIRDDGKVITKGIGVSIAYIPAVTSQMREDIMKQSLGIENPYVQRWEGERQGEIFCMSKDLDKGLDLYGLIRNFVQISGEVVKRQHPFRNHARVERFLSAQRQRLDFAKVAALDGQRILDTPEFTGWSAMNPNYKGEGKVYLIELYEEDGIVYGSAPNGSMRLITELSIDEPHKRWIEEGLISMIKRPIPFPGGFRIGADGEDTETVSRCCSYFFDLMENGTTVGFMGTSDLIHLWCERCVKNEGLRCKFCKKEIYGFEMHSHKICLLRI